MNGKSTSTIFMHFSSHIRTGVAGACALWLLAGLLLQTAAAQPPSFSSLANPSAQPQPLALEEAFPFFVSTTSPGRYKVSWNLAPGHYLYRHAFSFSLQQRENGELLEADVTLPDGLKKTDQFFGDIEAYYEQVVAELSLPTVPGPQAALVIEYQGCADWGFCYPPQRVSYPLTP
ncbi:MAG: protein-disulfide reductase DsbD N-terminal domain-containing protein [Proteobacteria bacterium]|nr:protein-disulfide reductase DsbD N-terminal domain-containing protein [Pseudomonadota bacterium]